MSRKTDIVFRRLSVADGLSQTRVAQIVQDDTGFIWLGTSYGVNRYDGYAYKTYAHVRGEVDSLSGVLVYSLFKDDTGKIWVGTDQDLDSYDESSGTFTHVVVDKGHPTVLHISQGPGGTLWLSTAQGLYNYDPASAAVRKFQHQPGDATTLSSNDVKSTALDSTGRVWVASSYGLELMDASLGKVLLRVPLRQEVFSQFGVHEDSHGLLWIYYKSGNGLAIFDPKTSVLKRIEIRGSESDSPLTGVADLLETQDGQIWIATARAGLLRFDREKFSFDQYVNDPNDIQSLADNRLTTLSQDREGNIWVGFEAAPPSVFPTARPRFTKIWPTPSQPSKFGESFVNAIFEDRQKFVWLGANASLIRLDVRDGTTRRYDLLGPGFDGEVVSIAQDEDGLLWLGTIGYGLLSFDPVSGAVIKQYRHDPADPTSISSDVVTKTLSDKAGLWITTYDGLSRLDRATGAFVSFRRRPPESNAFYSVIKDDLGDLWIGTALGLVRFTPNSSLFKTFIREPENPNSISNNTINNVLQDRSGEMWVGTQDGLNRIQHRDPTQTQGYFDSDGLPGNVISCMLEENGHLWISTNKGVVDFDPKTLKTTRYNTLDGLPGEDLTGWNACYRSQQGTMYFAGYAGAAMRTDNISQAVPFNPPIAFTDLEINGQTVRLRSGAALTIPNSSSLTVTFAALSFREPNATRYRYRLNGIDSDWHNVSSRRRSISYPYLPAGSYTLVVQAALSGENWTEPGASLQIHANPAWWETWWFLFGILTLAFAFLALGYTLRIRSLAEKFEIGLHERLAERSRVARDLHDTLLQSFQGLIYRLQATRQILHSRPDDAASMIDLILDRGDAALIEGRQAIQDLRDPHQFSGSFRSAIEREIKRLSDNHSSNQPTCVVQITEIEVPLSPTVREALVRISCEALRNAYHHSGASKIEYTLESSRGFVTVSIRDNGTGIDPGQDPDRYGLKGMRERAAEIGADYMLQTTLGSGTLIKVEYPTKGKWSLLRSWLGPNNV